MSSITMVRCLRWWLRSKPALGRHGSLPLLLLFCAPVFSQEPTQPVYYDSFQYGQTPKGGVLNLPANLPLDQNSEEVLKPAAALTTFAVTTLVNNGPSSNRVDFVFMGDGYIASEIPTYATLVDQIQQGIFSVLPYSIYASYFNVHRIDVISNQSGVDDFSQGIFKDTVLDMGLNCSGFPGFLCINQATAFTVASSAPGADQIFAMANGVTGFGNGYPSLSTISGTQGYIEIAPGVFVPWPDLSQTALHECGHSFAGLADEYASIASVYPGPEPVEPNATMLNASQLLAQQKKWYRWLNSPGVGTFEGCRYYQFGIYRPTQNSIMSGDFPIPPSADPYLDVNREQVLISIYKKVNPIDSYSPNTGQNWPSSTVFSIQVLKPSDHSLDIQWFVNDVAIAGETGDSFSFGAQILADGLYIVRAQVVDNTAWVRDEQARANWLTRSVQWTVLVGEAPSVPVVPGGVPGAGVPNSSNATSSSGGGGSKGFGCAMTETRQPDYVFIFGILALLLILGLRKNSFKRLSRSLPL